MKIENLPADAGTKTIVRQEKEYLEAGLVPDRTVPLPFVLGVPLEDQITALGFDLAGVVRQLNQVFVENVGGIFGARARAAIAKKEPLPTQADMDEIIAAYDFSGTRASSAESMPEEERLVRTQLRTHLRTLLREGILSNGVKLTVQTQKEAEAKTLPDNKVSLDDFNALEEAAYSKTKITFGEKELNFGGKPQFKEIEGEKVPGNLAGMVIYSEELAAQELEVRRRRRAISSVNA